MGHNFHTLPSLPPTTSLIKGDLAGDCAARLGNYIMEILLEQKLTLQLAPEQQEIQAGLEDDRVNRQLPDMRI